MIIKATVEFYDKYGLLLHSGFYAGNCTFEDSSLERVHAKGQAALDVFGALYSRAKTVTLRCDIPGKLFPVTLECVNPHHAE